jgi:hypothetical protein
MNANTTSRALRKKYIGRDANKYVSVTFQGGISQMERSYLPGSREQTTLARKQRQHQLEENSLLSLIVEGGSSDYSGAARGKGDECCKAYISY